MNLTVGPQAWDGALIDARGFKNVLIWATVAPSVAPALQGSPDGVAPAFTQSITQNKSTGVTTVATLANIALYTAPGGQFVELTGGTGGTYFIAGVN